MIGTVYIKNYKEPAFNTREILRYAGVRGEMPELEETLLYCIDEIRGKLSYKVCFREFPIACGGDLLDLGFTKTSSKAIKKNLEGCTSIVLFAATVGIEADRLIARYGTVSPTKALLFQAIGTERIESLCDIFNNEIKKEKGETRPRFSPGYGDFPLETQKDIFTVLDCARKIGLTLNESLLMSPSKSVTAVIGVAGQK